MASPGRSPPRARTGRRSRKASDVWTRPLWPVHLKPLPDELLSSWLVRLAYAHGLKAQTFSRLLAGSGYHLWNRDIDRTAPDWLIDDLCRNTATARNVANATTLRAYEGRIYRTFHDAYVLPWILPLKIRRFTRTGYGVQFCPRCLAGDAEPYFRRRWRVAFYTWCAKHEVMLHDRCPQCGAPVVFQRQETGQSSGSDDDSISRCHACHFDLREAPCVGPVFYEGTAGRAFRTAVRRLEQSGPTAKPSEVEYFNVLHHLCRMMSGQYRSVRPMEFACSCTGAVQLPLGPRPRTFEMRPIAERHHMVQLGFWYMADLKCRLTLAWQDGALTYSALFRDFEDRPASYDVILAEFSDWRSRPKRHVQPQGEGGRFLRLTRR